MFTYIERSFQVIIQSRVSETLSFISDQSLDQSNLKENKKTHVDNKAKTRPTIKLTRDAD